jgi:hypothetical protein
MRHLKDGSGARSISLLIVFVVLIGWVLAQQIGGNSARGQLEPKYVAQNAKIEFDRSNYLVFEDVERITSETGVRFGKYVVLHAVRDGNKDDIDLRDILSTTQVETIKYVDKAKVWIIYRRGHLLDGALLLDLASKRALHKYDGNYFSLSPDGKNIAYFRTYDKDSSTKVYLVFINDTMVYPALQDGVVWSVMSQPQTPDGRSLGDKFSRIEQSEPLTRLIWKNAKDLEFTIAEKTPDTTSTQPVAFLVSGTSAPGSSDMKVTTITRTPRK